jgi:hypothetical protein
VLGRHFRWAGDGAAGAFTCDEPSAIVAAAAELPLRALGWLAVCGEKAGAELPHSKGYVAEAAKAWGAGRNESEPTFGAASQVRGASRRAEGWIKAMAPPE